MSNSTTAYPTDFRGWLAKVISFNTVSRNSNLPLIYYVRDYLQSVGITDIEIIPDPKRDTHANLFATLPGKGGVKHGGIVLSGHTDVVPVDGQKWDTDPFTMVEKDGKLYGRGACDMKAFLANVLALVPTFLKMNRTKPVHIAFSYDEEVGCLGVPIMADHLKKRGFKADACLVGESTNMQVRTGSKGYIQWDVQVKGKAIHSSMALMNTSCNSIEYAAKIICKIREIAIDLRDNGPRDDAYACPFSAITVGLIKGGIAVNTVPAECSFTFNIRVTDTKTADEVEQKVKDFIDKEVLPEMRKEYPEASITMPRLTTMPAFNARETDAFTKHVRALCKDNTIRKTPGGTEAGFFQETLNIPTVIVGAGGGAAHMANEYVTVELMEKSKKFTEDIVAMYTGAAAMPKL